MDNTKIIVETPVTEEPVTEVIIEEIKPSSEPTFNYEPEKKDNTKFGEAACIVGLVAACVSFFCNTCYVFSLVAIVFNILGLCMGKKNKTLAIVGISLVPVAIIVQIVIDIITGGIGLFF